MKRPLEFLKQHWQLIVMAIGVFVLWNTVVMTPLRILIVFLHEASHAIAALLTGGSVLEMSLSPQEGGHVVSRGGNFFIIATAGYIGSLLFGIVFFVLALRTRADRFVVAGLGITMIGLAAIYMRELFPLLFCLGTGAALLAASRYFSQSANDFILRIIGLTSMIYVPYDIVSDTLLRSHLNSDARIIAEHFGGPTMFWGLLWLVISLGFIVLTLRNTLSEPSNIAFKIPLKFRSKQAARKDL